MVLGTKYDLPVSKKEVYDWEVRELKKQIKIPILNVSSKENKNIKLAFIKCIEGIMKKNNKVKRKRRKKGSKAKKGKCIIF